MGDRRLRPGALPLATLCLRSLLVQVAWNSERMLNLGLTMLMAPVVAQAHGTGAAGRAALRKYLSFFNTHPYFVSLMVGMYARLELTEPDAAKVAQAKVASERLLGPLAAAGGAFFWEGLRPLWGLIGVAWVLLAPEALAAWGVLLAVLGYNLTHLHMRWYGLGAGWRDGEQAIREYLRHFRGRLGTVHRVGLLLLGGLMVYLPDALLTGGMRPSQPVAITLDYLGWLLGAWLLFGVFLYALRQQLGVTRILFICAVMAQLAAWGGALWR